MPSAINMQVGIPRRHLILLLCGLGLMISYADRSNMAVAIVAIASEFHYSKSQQGIILASFFIGYILTPIVGGTLADRYGGKAVLAFGAAAWTVFTLLTPFASEMGLGWVVAVRIALGLGEGVAYPSVHAMIGTWIPPSERSKAVATVTAFSYLGGVIALPTSSALVVSPWGWRSVFWLFGTLGLLWSIAWQIWGASNPLSCRGISESELHWLLEQQKLDRQVNNTQSDPQWDSEERLNEQEPSRIISTNGARITYRPISTSAVELAESRSSEDSTDGVTTNPFGASANQTQHPSTSRSAMAMRWQKFRSEVLSGTSVRRGEDEVAVAVPWKDLLARREVWAVIISQFCNSIGFFVMQSWIPTFYLDFYGVDVGKIGYYAVLPSALQGFMGFIAGFLGDKAIQDWNWSPLTVRRVAQTTGSVGLGVFLLLAVNFAHTATLAMALIAIGMALNGFTMIGASAYQHDFCPQHAGFIFALGNTAGSLPALIGVFVVGLLLDRDSVGRWGLIWTTVCLFYFLGSAVFVLLSTNRRYPQ
ncbi:unnamed protein product [Mortierella alpina]